METPPTDSSCIPDVVPLPEPWRLRLLVVLSQILGIRQVSASIRRELESMSAEIDLEFVVFTAEHYESHRRFPRWAIWNRVFESAYCARALIAEKDPGSFDAYLVTGPELMHALSPWTKSKPLILYTDSTDRLSHAQVAALDPSPLSWVKQSFNDFVTGAVYRPLLRRQVVALAESEWCSESLQRDYGISPSSIWVACGTIDLETWCPPPVARATLVGRKARLLFVGNDFQRKGGPFLMDIFERLDGTCELTIVSKDFRASAVASTPGITVIQDLDHLNLERLIRLYQESDLLVFPTWIDKMPNVVREACATGLPIVARDCGAIGSVVQDGVNGRLLPFNSSPADWVFAIEILLADEAVLCAMGLASRQIAESRLSRHTLGKSVNAALKKVRAELE